ncbi:MAG: hypothetical protein NTW59_03430 [Candidatus Diapherotrites archaeon]|nr:hypothetical protein [Candidatus Diapherotrites archaeon]
MRFGLRQGPWTAIFSGVFQGHETELLSNQDGFLLLLVYEKQAGQVSGVVLQAFAAFSAMGEVSAFVETMQREAIAFSRHDGRQTISFIAIPSKPAYSGPVEEEVAGAVDDLIVQLRQGIRVITDVARAYDLELLPLQQCSGEVKAAFFAQPLIVPLLSREKMGAETAAPVAAQAQPMGTGSVILGITREGKAVTEPFSLFRETVVSGGTTGERARLLHIIAEGSLLSNLPTIIFDHENRFFGLNQPNQNPSELHGYGVQAESIGFPLAVFTPHKEVKASLGAVDKRGMLQLLGCEQGGITELFAREIAESKPQSPDALAAALDARVSGDEAHQFALMRAGRVAKAIGLLYPDFFDGDNNMSEIAKKWFKAIGRASIINIVGLYGREKQLLLDSLVNELLEFFRPQGETTQLRAMIVLPWTEKIFPPKMNITQQHLLGALGEMRKFGVGFAAGCEKEVLLNEGVLALAGAKANIVGGNDASVQLRDKRAYRVLLRPGLSTMK